MVEFKTSSELVDYDDAVAFMEARVAGIRAGTEDECVWFLEHPPLYTAGTSAKEADLLDARFPVYSSGRGGEYTYHGPGQRVAYVMLDLKRRSEKGAGSRENEDPRLCGESSFRKAQPDIKHYVWQLEEWIIQSLGAFDVVGERREGRIGIWVDTQDTLSLNPSPSRERESERSEPGEGGAKEKKIAALGVRVRHWVTYHGIAINVAPDLSHFGGIVPCGISDYGVTSFQDLGLDVSLDALDKVLEEQFFEVF